MTKMYKISQERLDAYDELLDKVSSGFKILKSKSKLKKHRKLIEDISQ